MVQLDGRCSSRDMRQKHPVHAAGWNIEGQGSADLQLANGCQVATKSQPQPQRIWSRPLFVATEDFDPARLVLVICLSPL